MKLIKQVYDLIQLATDKGITAYWSNEQIMDAVDQGQMQFYRQCLEKYARDKRVRNILLPFEEIAPMTVNVNNNTAALPSDFEHELELYVTVDSVEYPLHLEELGMFRQRTQDPVDPPTTTSAIYCIYTQSEAKILKIYPYITPVLMHYFRRPTKPVFATDEVNGQLVYSDDDSTDVQFSAVYHDILVENALAILGLGMRDGAVMRAGQKAEHREAHI